VTVLPVFKTSFGRRWNVGTVAIRAQNTLSSVVVVSWT